MEMRKICLGLLALFYSAVMISCSNYVFIKDGVKETDSAYEYEVDNDKINITCYKVNKTNEFSAFLNAGEERSVTKDDETFNSFISLLSEEEITFISDNMSNLELDIEYVVSFPNISESRNIEDYETGFGDYATLCAIHLWLEENFGEYYIPYSFYNKYLSEDNINITEEIAASALLEYMMRTDNDDGIECVLDYCNSIELLEKTQAEKERVRKIILKSEEENSRASFVVSYQEDKLIIDLYKKLKDGDILLMKCKDPAYIVAGVWSHSGIYSKSAFLKDDVSYGDGKHCIYTAQPDAYNDFPEEMKPDRPGFTCKDTIYMYTRQLGVSVLRPKKYTEDNGKNAADYAEREFYDKNTAYNIPLNEYFGFGDTSHDLKADNPYCSKVVYSSWYSQGINLDSNVFAGNFVSPDDIYGSTADHYKRISIKVKNNGRSIVGEDRTRDPDEIIWKTVKVFDASTDLILEKRK